MNCTVEPIWQCIKVQKGKDTVQQYIRKNSLLMNKEAIDVFKMYTCVKKYKQIIFFVVLYPKRREIYAEVCRN